MKAFTWLEAESFAAASRHLAKTPGAHAKGAGVDLVDLLKERIVEPAEVVHLRRAKVEVPPGAISALATLAEVAADPRLRAEFPAIAIAAAEAATPQIRNQATVGGNLCQHTRCWYFRGKTFPCRKRGDAQCGAMLPGAQDRYHAVLPSPLCASAHPSNLAPALIAVKAKIACTHPDGDRILAAEELYEAPKAGKLSDTVLRPGELIRAVLLEPTPMAKRSTYLEFRERQAFDYALVSVAVALRSDGNQIAEARIVLGAVAPTPHRATAAEAALVGKPLTGPAIGAAAAATLADAAPTGENKYKVPIARVLVRRALEALAS